MKFLCCLLWATHLIRQDKVCILVAIFINKATWNNFTLKIVHTDQTLVSELYEYLIVTIWSGYYFCSQVTDEDIERHKG